ncbi:MAG: copper amine oxidase N-terminal domain-containing protein [Defluviitaleaceae bacterium]|nr:copper amine oxidase N-terminal domain-containing protein [Defluviitaleaceae bacterium]
MKKKINVKGLVAFNLVLLSMIAAVTVFAGVSGITFPTSIGSPAQRPFVVYETGLYTFRITYGNRNTNHEWITILDSNNNPIAPESVEVVQGNWTWQIFHDFTFLLTEGQYTLTNIQMASALRLDMFWTAVEIPEPTVLVTSNNPAWGTASLSIDGNQGNLVATPTTGHVLFGWNVTSGPAITITPRPSHPNEAYFVWPPPDHIEIQAEFRAINIESGPSGGSSEGGGYTPQPTQTPPPAPIITIPVNGIGVAYRVVNNRITFTLPTNTVTNIVNVANDTASFDLSSVRNATTIVIPRTAMNRFVAAGLGVELILPDATLHFDAAAANSLNTGRGDITISISQAFNDADSTLTVTAYAGTQRINEIAGALQVTVPWNGGTPVTAGILADDGFFYLLPSQFNFENSSVTFTANNLATFIVRYNSITPPQTISTLRFSVGSAIFNNNGSLVFGDAAPFIDADTNRTMVPIRAIAEGLGAAVSWNDITRTVTIELEDNFVNITIGTPLPDGMGTAVIVHDRTFVPVRYVSEILGADVRWDDVSRAVYIYH